MLQALLPDRARRRRGAAGRPHPRPGRGPGRHLGRAARPLAVAEARKNACRQLAAWGLDDAAFVTELVVSELVTNAIRYGGAPIQLRLIRDRTLICEVSDASSTAPHLRRARTFDEGGRGLLLVAQLTAALGHPPDVHRQDDLGRTGPPRHLTAERTSS